MSLPASNLDARIDVTVLSGFLGSGKTTLLNRLLRLPAFSGALVVVNEFGEIGIDHHLIRSSEDRVAIIAGGCLCCTVRGGLVDTLRDMFMAAMARRIPPFSKVLIETTGLADPAPVRFTVTHEPILAQRFVYRGAVVVADATHVARQIDLQPEVARQLAFADLIWLSKTDLASTEQTAAAQRAVAGINAFAPCIDGAAPAALQWLEATLRTGPSPRAAAPDYVPRLSAGVHGRVHQVSVVLGEAISRLAFAQAMEGVCAALGEALLRMKGAVRFKRADGSSHPYTVQALHDVMYEPTSMGEAVYAALAATAEVPPQGGGVLVLIVRNISRGRVAAALQGAFATASLR